MEQWFASARDKGELASRGKEGGEKKIEFQTSKQLAQTRWGERRRGR